MSSNPTTRAHTHAHISIKSCKKTVFSLSRTISMTTERLEEIQQKNVFYLGRDTCFLSSGITGPLLPPFSSRYANCFRN